MGQLPSRLTAASAIWTPPRPAPPALLRHPDTCSRQLRHTAARHVASKNLLVCYYKHHPRNPERRKQFKKYMHPLQYGPDYALFVVCKSVEISWTQLITYIHNRHKTLKRISQFVTNICSHCRWPRYYCLTPDSVTTKPNRSMSCKQWKR